jgi:hypothetical protein
MYIELIFGWKLYDYLAYQRYRFTVREHRYGDLHIFFSHFYIYLYSHMYIYIYLFTNVHHHLYQDFSIEPHKAFVLLPLPPITFSHRWILRNQVIDESLSQEFHCLDLMCFSSQFYYIMV